MGSDSDLYLNPLPSSRTGPLYNAFPYPTKISPEAIALFIATHTKPGDVVLDVFGGSGTTGLAALLCDKPTEKMLQMVNDAGVHPSWGPRSAIIYEVGTLASFVSEVMSNPPDADEFQLATNSLLSMAEKSHGWIWKTQDSEGRECDVRHIIWSDVLICPLCDHETTYWEASVELDPARFNKLFPCAGCTNEIAVSDCTRSTERYEDPLLGTTIDRKKRVPVRVHGKSGSKQWQAPPSQYDEDLIQKVDGLPLPTTAPIAKIKWGDLHRAGYHQGITHLHHFYTHRSFYCLAELWELITSFPEDIQPALKLWVLSYNSSHSTLMTRVVAKKAQKDLVLTGAQSGVLYVSGLPIEKNILTGLKRKAGVFSNAFRLVNRSESKVKVINASSEELDIPDCSIDYVFTDPPFGGYIPYAEINQINELWLGKTTNQENEIIISRSQGKDAEIYGAMLGRVFTEICRVLKPSGSATVVFHSAHSEVWNQLQMAILSAGLFVAATSVLDKLQSSFKQTAAKISVKGDPLIKLVKQRPRTGSPPLSTQALLRNLVGDVLSGKLSAEESRPERLYSRFVGACLETGISVDLDASSFYQELEQLELDDSPRNSNG